MGKDNIFMRRAGISLAVVWGIAGVLAILGFAVYRLYPIAGEALSGGDLQWWHWLFLLFWMVFMIYSEGIRGFHYGFSPRVVARARSLTTDPNLISSILAPLFCFGFFRATRKRRIVSWSVAGGVALLILLVRLLPQPWRGLVDAGVVAGLGIGILSILYYALLWWRYDLIHGSADLPPQAP